MVSVTAKQVEAGQAIYTRGVLRIYDFAVLSVSNQFILEMPDAEKTLLGLPRRVFVLLAFLRYLPSCTFTHATLLNCELGFTTPLPRLRLGSGKRLPRACASLIGNR